MVQGCAGSGAQGERCRAVAEVPRTRFFQTTSQNTLETQVCRIWPPSHQLVAPSQNLAQPLDVDDHSTSTPKAGSSSCTEEVEQTKNKKQRKEKDPRMSAITPAGVRDLFGGDDGKSFPRQASGMSAGELEKMKKEKEKQFENDPRMSSMTSSGLLDLFGTAVAKEQPCVLEFISRLSSVMFSCACKARCRRHRCLHTAHMTHIHTLILCLIQRPSVNTASHSTNQPNATHPAQRQELSQSPTAPAGRPPAGNPPPTSLPDNWPTSCQLHANCLSTFCQHVDNL